MKTWALLFACASAWASPTSPLTLSNFHSETQTNALFGAGSWSFDIQEPCLASVSVCLNQLLPGEIQLTLPLDGSFALSSGAVRQFINATASVDYSAPGYTVRLFTLAGGVFSGGILARQEVDIVAPCRVAIDLVEPQGHCGPGGSSGTLTVLAQLSADAVSNGHADTSEVRGVTVTLSLVPIPEPALWPVVLIGILGLALRKRVITHVCIFDSRTQPIA